MSAHLPIRGVFCAAATPVAEDLAPDLASFAEHCLGLIEDGCDGIALLGTTGEANSFSIKERQAILEAAVATGVAPDRLMPGTGACAVPDAVGLTKHALSLGVVRVVLLPPFYYKGVSDDGLFAAYAETIERVGDSRLRIILYHIPQMSSVPLSLDLIGRLTEAYPSMVAGIKDSGGDLAHMERVVGAFPRLAVFAGADPLMLPLLKAGGAGCITATSNLVGRDLAAVYRHVDDPAHEAEVAEAQDRIVAMRTLSNRYAQIPAIKAMIAHRRGEPGWARVRPPLRALTPELVAEIGAAMAAIEAGAGSTRDPSRAAFKRPAPAMTSTTT